MKICPHCHAEVEENSVYCPYCGRHAGIGDPDAYRSAFHTFRRNLRHERKCWSIAGGVHIGIVILFAVMGLLLLVAGIVGSDPTVLGGALELLIYALLLAPVAAVNLIMKRKLDGYIEQVETNPVPAKERAKSIGMIVLAAFFNEIAMIFIILNFVHVKSNGHLIRQ